MKKLLLIVSFIVLVLIYSYIETNNITFSFDILPKSHLIQGKIVNKYDEPFVSGGYNYGTDFMFSIKNAYQGDSIVENKRVSSEDYGKYQIGDWYKIH